MIATDYTLDTQSFLNHLFRDTAGFFELTYIDPSGYYGLDPHIRTDSYQIGRDIPDWDRVDAYNDDGYSVYYSLTTKMRRLAHERQRSSEKDALWVSCLWCEVDLKAGVYDDHEDIYNAILDLPEPATVIINSGGGLHALWRITPIQVTGDNFAAIKEVLRGLAVAVQGDTSVAELARVFRLPGTINTKPERGGAWCEVIDALPGEYAFEQFLPYRKLVQPETRPIQRDLPALPGDGVPGYVTWYCDTTHAEGQRNSSLNWAAHKMYSDGYSESQAVDWLLSRALIDGLSEREALRTIRSAYSGKRGEPSYVSARGSARMRAGDAVRRGDE